MPFDSLINHAIANLFNGVSQQSPSIRQPSQCELQENALSSIVDGVFKRPATVHIGKLSNSLYGNAYVHFINRDPTERYVVVVSNGFLEVWDVLGNKRTLNAPDGFAYLSSTSPDTDFSLVTIADYTILVNKTVKTALSSGTTAANPSNVVFFFVSAAPAQHTIYATVDGVTASASLGTSGGTQGGLAASLASNLQSSLGGNYSVTRPQPEVIQVTKSSGAIVSMSCFDTYGNAAIRCLNTGVTEYSNLPAKFVSGFVIPITGELGGTSSTYYVQWNDSLQAYEETVKPGSQFHLDPATLPHKLVRNADGTCTFSAISWDDRKVGDPAVNLDPSFIGRPLNDVFFYRNRLGVLAGENVVFSRAGDFFNFFQETITQVLDTDPIDIAVSHVKVSDLHFAIPFDKNLVLFSGQTQFVLTATDMLTPKTVAIHQTTEFECSLKAKPVAAGSNIYFAVDKTGYTGVREYYVANYQLTFDADNITAHVPRYLPGDTFKLVSSTNEDMLFALSRDEQNTLYVYKFYWQGEEKAQSSWSKWTFGEDAKILSVEMMNTQMFLLIQRSDGTYLERLDVQTGLKEDDMPILVLLDRKLYLKGTYYPDINRTRWVVPYEVTDLRVILGGGFGSSAGVVVNATATSTPTLWEAMGDFSAAEAYLGVPYVMRYRFSPQYVRDQNKVAIAEAKLKIRHMRLFYTQSGYFQVNVTPLGRDTTTYTWTGEQLGTSSATLGKIPLGSGMFKFPVVSDGETTIIELTNATHLPCYFQSAEWEGFVTSRSSRM